MCDPSLIVAGIGGAASLAQGFGGMQAGNANALVIGGFQQSLGVYLYENEALARLVEVAAERSEGQ